MTKRQRKWMIVILVIAWVFTITAIAAGIGLILWDVDTEVGVYTLASGVLFGMIAKLLGEKRIQVSLFSDNF